MTKTGLAKVAHWLSTQKFLLIRNSPLGRGHLLVLPNNTGAVLVGRNLTDASALVVALHECGHLLLFQERLKSPSKRVAGMTLREWESLMCPDRRRRPTSRTHAKGPRLTVVQEEIEAWDKGAELAKIMRIRVVSSTWRRLRQQGLLSYCRWTVAR